MTKEFIPYIEALALKELGFDEPCFGYYYHENSFTKCRPQIYYSDTFNECNRNEEIPLDSCKAPLYSQAFRWFREKQNLYGAYMMGDDWNNFYFHIWRNDTMTKTFVTSSNWVYETYEEAELACLIKLIEIVKNK